MYLSKKIACVIPARLASTRFPKKILAILGGKPLLQRVYEAALNCKIFDEIVVAVDHEETEKTAKGFGAKTVMTSAEHLNGTQRLIEVKESHQLGADIYVNWQADEPFITEDILEDLLQTCNQDAQIWTLRKKITESSEIEDPSIVKVVVDSEENALYFSRSPIPYYREKEKEQLYYKHIGLYAYSAEALKYISRLKPCSLELAESLEQLRFIYNQMKIKVHLTSHQTLGIDLPEHLVQAEKILKELSFLKELALNKSL